jgi:hypothetical protein
MKGNKQDLRKNRVPKLPIFPRDFHFSSEISSFSLREIGISWENGVPKLALKVTSHRRIFSNLQKHKSSDYQGKKARLVA